MYLAELHGKLSSKTERLEDILTSNVFSFFKYSNRALFLRRYLMMLGFDLSSEEANNAEFVFWPRYEKNTEPDLVIRAGKYYILIEAKYFSDFDPGNKEVKAQLIREIEGGGLEANNDDLEFHLIAITADYYYKEDKFGIIPKAFRGNFKWTNWQKVTSFLEDTLEEDQNICEYEKDFAHDLFALLDKKNLRNFQGPNKLSGLKLLPKYFDSVFLKAKTARFRGAFIGFTESLSLDEMITSHDKSVFWERIFFKILEQKFMLNNYNTVFYQEK